MNILSVSQGCLDVMILSQVRMKHQRNGKKRKVNDLNSEGMDEIELRNTILYHKHEYKRKLELGKAVHKIVINDEVDEDELLPEHKEALDLHLKKSMETIPNNIELNP